MTKPATRSPQGSVSPEHPRRCVRLLFIANDSLVLPILFSQGLPHLRALASRGHAIWILSFEGGQPYYAEQQGVYSEVSRQLRNAGVCPTAPPAFLLRRLPTTLAKLAAGSLYALVLVTRHRIEVVHARSFFPALIGLLCQRLLHTRLIFDMRSLYVDEQVPLGRLVPGTTRYRFMRRLERRLLRASDAIVTVSEPFADHMRNRRDVWREPPADRIYVVPNCVDPQRFQLRPEVRQRQREQLHVEQRTVLLAVMSWMSQRYAVDRLTDFFLQFHRLDPTAFLLVLANRPSQEEAERQLRDRGLRTGDLKVLSACPGEVPARMQAGDVGIFFGGRGFNQKIVFPIKFAEYLACGIPVVIDRQIEHLARLVEEERVGVTVDVNSRGGIERGARHLHQFLQEKQNRIRNRCRKVALERLSLSRAVEIYDQIYRELARR